MARADSGPVEGPKMSEEILVEAVLYHRYLARGDDRLHCCIGQVGKTPGSRMN